MQLQRPISRRKAAGYLLGGIAAASAITAMPALALPEDAAPVSYEGADAIAILENDHRRIHHALDALVAGAKTRRHILESLSMLFAVHNTTEESFIYPAIRFTAHRETDAATLFHQQDEAKVVVWRLNQMLQMDEADSDQFISLAKMLRTAALEHVALEEETDFPALRAALTNRQLSDLTEQVRSFRRRFA